MTEHREYRVVCADGYPGPHGQEWEAVEDAAFLDDKHGPDCSPHRVESRVVGDWGVEG